MNPRLLALMAGGVVVSIAGLTVRAYVPRAGTTKAQLIDAGFREDCNLRRVACTVLEADGGYDEKEFTVGVCPTGPGLPREVVFPRKARQFSDRVADLDANCRVISNPADVDLNEDPPSRPGSCACWNPAAGACSRQLLDGGSAPAIHGNEIPSGEWAGPGCVRKPCGEVYGFPSMPEVCR